VKQSTHNALLSQQMSGTTKCGPSRVNNPRQLVKLDGSLISSKAVLNLHNVTMLNQSPQT